MNDEKCVKENPNPAKAKELAGIILNCNISDQNEIFDIMRRAIVDGRTQYIDRLEQDLANLAEQIKYAKDSLNAIMVSELK